MGRLVSLAVLFGILVAPFSASADICSTPTLEERIEGSDVVFDATVINIKDANSQMNADKDKYGIYVDENWDDPPHLYSEVIVHEVYKGHADRVTRVWIDQNWQFIGLPFGPGDRAVLFIETAADGRLFAYTCWSTAFVDDQGEYRKFQAEDMKAYLEGFEW